MVSAQQSEQITKLLREQVQGLVKQIGNIVVYAAYHQYAIRFMSLQIAKFASYHKKVVTVNGFGETKSQGFLMLMSYSSNLPIV